VSCGFSREALALHVGGDLHGAAAAATLSHVAACEECRRFLEELRASQALLKSGRGEMASQSDCTAMRRQVMTIIHERPDTLGWGLRIERAIALGLRPSYGLAAILLLGMVSVSVLAQIRPATHTLARPDGYRGWALVSRHGGGKAASADRVYVMQSSYQAYENTGIIPEGTVFVWEAAPESSVSGSRLSGVEGPGLGPHSSSSTLLVSVKDSAKFEGGWGFFDFSGTGEAPSGKARVHESKGCRACHRQSPLSLGA
jgi:hypothetical protein